MSPLPDSPSPAILALHPDTVDLIARVRIEGDIEPDAFLELGWLGRGARTMEEWMGSPAHELEHGPMILGFDLADDEFDPRFDEVP